jgi:hypothetical protein
MFVRFGSGACLGIQKKVFVFLFVHILHGFAHFGPFCTPISVPFDFVSGACLRIQ